MKSRWTPGAEGSAISGAKIVVQVVPSGLPSTELQRLRRRHSEMPLPSSEARGSGHLTSAAPKSGKSNRLGDIPHS